MIAVRRRRILSDHLNRSVVRLHFEGTSHTVEPTALHKFWSVDRAEWVAAGELSIGERILREGGAARIASIERLEGAHQVFNFEVAGAHTYLVSELKLKTHNTCRYEVTLNNIGPRALEGLDSMPAGMRDAFTNAMQRLSNSSNPGKLATHIGWDGPSKIYITIRSFTPQVPPTYQPWIVRYFGR